MATCKHCGRPLILKDGKCLRCGKGPNEQITPNDGDKNSASGLPPVRTFTINGVSFNMILVEGGTFWMGAQNQDPRKPNYDPEAYGGHVRQVSVDTFYIGETLVTLELFDALFHCSSLYPKGITKNTPVSDHRDVYSEVASRTGEFFRMPTEEEWEFAARGGNKSKGYRFAGSNILEDVGWYSTNRHFFVDSVYPKEPDYNTEEHNQYVDFLRYSPPPVKMKKPNELGLYDMSGLLFEKCMRGDIYYKTVYKGGYFASEPKYCRIAASNSGVSSSIAGLRLAMTPKYERAKQQ